MILPERGCFQNTGSSREQLPDQNISPAARRCRSIWRRGGAAARRWTTWCNSVRSGFHSTGGVPPHAHNCSSHYNTSTNNGRPPTAVPYIKWIDVADRRRKLMQQINVEDWCSRLMEPIDAAKEWSETTANKVCGGWDPQNGAQNYRLCQGSWRTKLT